MSTEVDAFRKSKEQKVKKRRMEAKVTPAVDELRKEDKMMHKTDRLGEDPTLIKDRKKKRKRKGSEVDSGTVNATATESGIELAENDGTKEKKKRKETEAADAEESKREKAKKRSSNNEEDATREGATSSDTRKVSREKKSDKESKKRSKNERIKDKTLPDPSDDASLSEKSRGALSYAYARLSSPSSWKFNKAQQNWIVKHFFEFEEIPEIYIPMVAGYLAGSQGGVRENLIQACNKRLDQTVSEQISDAKTGKDASTAALSESIERTEVSEARDALKTRARVLLKTLEHTSS